MSFKQYYTVKLITDKYTARGVKQGHIGVVLEIYGDGHYEVEFSDTDGTTLLLGAFPESELEEVSPEW